MYQYKVRHGILKVGVEEELNRLSKYGWRLTTVNQQHNRISTWAGTAQTSKRNASGRD